MKFDIEEVREFISNTSPSTKIYIGSDSECYFSSGEWFAKYTVAIVIHYDGSRGCKIFGEFTSERNFDKRKNRPTYRLMNEVLRRLRCIWT